MEKVLSRFQFEGQPLSCERFGEGHINRTYLVVTDSRRRYILQCISRAAFHNIPALMQNIEAVTAYLAQRSEDPRASLHLIPGVEGGFWVRDEAGEYWRVYDFIEDSICLQTPEMPEDFYQSGVAFGSFQRMLHDFPAETLSETIPNFHNTPNRYRIFHETLGADRLNRAESVCREIDFVLAREAEAGILLDMCAEGELPLRVTHNDTKLNNVMLDSKTRKALCVIDLDTVMPGLVAYDFGDSIRFGASTAREDERDLDKVGLDLSLYRRFCEGFIPACGALTEKEIETLPLGAKLMTLECGLRFLTDYLDGDRYFSVTRPGHNLDRARTQFKLVAETERRWDDIQRIVRAFMA
ncbi:MAG: aminoglycoside phosphotransferase family protein [Oscillospiraceae bacterium]|nr:aminoglycoside phosphotransferase family protein [Oscillospiraceae bacterium]